MSFIAWPKVALERYKSGKRTLLRLQVRTPDGTNIRSAGDYDPDVALAAYKILLGQDPHEVAQELAPREPKTCRNCGSTSLTPRCMECGA